MTVQRIAHTLDRMGFTPRGATVLVVLVVLLALPLAITWRLLRLLA